jgi:hypothetical protein
MRYIISNFNEIVIDVQTAATSSISQLLALETPVAGSVSSSVYRG